MSHGGSLVAGIKAGDEDYLIMGRKHISYANALPPSGASKPSLSGCSPRRRSLGAACHAPHRVADIVRDQQRTGFVDGQAHGPAARLILVVEESGHHVLRHAVGFSAGE